jgi:hypothetical protein
MGQCVPTSLIVQDLFGGIILRTNADGKHPHYFNRLAGGTEVDLTRDQFLPNTVFEPPWEFRRQNMLHSSGAIEAGIIGQYTHLCRLLGLPART